MSNQYFVQGLVQSGSTPNTLLSRHLQGTDPHGDRAYADSLVAHIAGAYDVTKYGATGNGVTDDTSAIHAARDAAGAGGTLYFPPGTYVAKNLAASVDNQTWTLHRLATVKMSGSNTVSDYLLRATCSTGFRIDGGIWDCTAGNSGRANMIYTSSCTKVWWKNMTVLGAPSFTSCNILHVVNASDVWIDNCSVTNGGIAIQNSSSPSGLRTNHKVTNCTVDLTAQSSPMPNGGAITFYGDSESQQLSQVKCTGNRVLANFPSSNNANAGYSIHCVRDAAVESNYASGFCINYTIVGASGATTNASNNVVFNGNVSKDFFQYGVEIAANRMTISNNTIDGGAHGVSGSVWGIAIDQVNAGGGYDVISGNVISNITATNVVGAALAQTGGSTSLAVTGNVISVTGTSSAYGFYFPVNGTTTTKYVTISGNSIDLNSSPSSAGMLISSGIDGLSVTGNLFARGTSAVAVSCGTAVTVNNLAVIGNTLTGVTNLRTSSMSGGAAYGSNVIYTDNNDSTRDATVTRVKAGTPADSDFDSPVSGMIVVDTTASKIWVRVGTTWKSVAVA